MNLSDYEAKNLHQCIKAKIAQWNDETNYKKKIWESFHCGFNELESNRYNTAASRLYYCLFQSLILKNNFFDLIGRSNIKHKQLADYLEKKNYSDIDIFKSFYDLRMKADYFSKSVKEKYIRELLIDFLIALDNIISEVSLNDNNKR